MIRTTQAQATHFILQKNYLCVKATELSQLINTLGGLPGAPLLSPFLAAYARLPHFKPADLLTGLAQNGDLIRGNLMRNQHYIVTAEKFTHFYAATARQRKQSLNAEFRLWGVDNSDIERLGEAIMGIIGNQPLTSQSIAEQLAPEARRELTQTSRGGQVSVTSNVDLALRWLAANGQLCAGREQGMLDWRAEEMVYAPLRYWQPGIDLTDLPDEAQAQAEVTRAYLAAFGPATEADISFWSGFGKSETARAVSALSSEMTMTLVEGIPGMTLLLKEQAQALQATEPFSVPVVKALPANDPFTTAHRASRSRYFSDPSLQRQVFDSKGGAKPVIVVNGQIVGVWDEPNQESFGMIDWRLLASVEAKIEPLIEAEIERVEKFLE